MIGVKDVGHPTSTPYLVAAMYTSYRYYEFTHLVDFDEL